MNLVAPPQRPRLDAALTCSDCHRYALHPRSPTDIPGVRIRIRTTEPNVPVRSSTKPHQYGPAGPLEVEERTRSSTQDLLFPPQPLPHYLSHATQAHATPPPSRRDRHKQAPPPRPRARLAGAAASPHHQPPTSVRSDGENARWSCSGSTTKF